MLQVRLLGELAVDADGSEVVLSGSWRARSLFAWLALNPGLHLRSDLAARFWPDVLDTSARASLRNALWAIRRELGPASEALETTRERVGLTSVSTDVAEFARLSAEDRLEDAVALWSGEPLAGLEDDWAYEARDDLNRQLSGVLARLAGAAQDAGDLETAVDWTRRRVALDPLAEDAQRELISRLAAQGDRAGALEAYAKLRERLRRDLGIAPSGATRELVELIRDEPAAPTPPRPPLAQREDPAGTGWRPGDPVPLPPRLRLDRAVPLIGRNAELETLRLLLNGARQGSGPRLALITGEAGIGKTRLAWELGIEAHQSGSVVLQGSCEEETLTPYGPFVEALHRWAPDLTGPTRHDSFETVANLLSSLAAEQPVLLVIDDFQWADASSAALLRHVICSRPEASLFVVATYRSGEVPPDAPVGEALSRLNQDGLLRRLPLSGLDRQEVDELVRALAGSDTPSGLTAAVHAETDGNPFFVAEIARRLGEDDAAHRLELPESVRDLIERRLTRLTDPCLRLLTVAAIVGREFDLYPLQRASELDPEALDEALEEAIGAGLIVELPGFGDRLAFTHTTIRRAIVDRLSRSRRKRIHARVAEALDGASQLQDAEASVAYHLCEAGEAGDPVKAVEYASRVAERAIASMSYAEAIELYTRALPLLPPDDTLRRKMALRRALAFQALGHQYTGDSSHPGASVPRSDEPHITT